MKQLLGHTSPETAYVVDGYPYGFRLRCKIRYWIETTKHGQRFVSQTTNPKAGYEVWNKPKASTYSMVRVMYIDESTGHVENDGIGLYASDEALVAFHERYPEAGMEHRLKVTAAALHAAAEARRSAD